MYYILCKQRYLYMAKKKNRYRMKNIVKRCVWRGIVPIHYTYAHVKQKQGKIRKRSFLDNIKAYIYLPGARANGGGGESGNPSISITRTIGRLFECFDGEPFCLRAVIYAYLCTIYIYIHSKYVIHILHTTRIGEFTL